MMGVSVRKLSMRERDVSVTGQSVQAVLSTSVLPSFPVSDIRPSTAPQAAYAKCDPVARCASGPGCRVQRVIHGVSVQCTS